MTAPLNTKSSHEGRKAATAVALFSSLVLAGAMAAVACGDGTADSLLGASGGPGSSSGGPGDDGGPGGPGPNDDGSILDPDGGTGTALKLAEKLFRDLQSDLVKTCGGASCHEGSTTAPLWLKPPDPYASVKTYDSQVSGDKKFIVPDTLTSRLFTKGNHAGPAMPTPDGTGNLGDKVKKWLDIEAAALVATKLPATAPVAVVAGPNTIDISTAGTGIAGAKITFNASVGTFLSLTNVQLVGGTTSGVHIVHPIFVQVPADPKATPLEDPADNGSNVDDTAGAGKSIAVGPGTFILTGFSWQATDKLQIEFAKVEAGTVTDTDGGGAVGCKNVNGFKAIAGVFMGGQVNGAALTPNCTAGCHKTGGGGDGALDLNALVLGTPDYTAACNQALTKVTLANKAQSPLILHPTGQMGNHGGGTVSDVAGYTTQINTWLAGE